MSVASLSGGFDLSARLSFSDSFPKLFPPAFPFSLGCLCGFLFVCQKIVWPQASTAYFAFLLLDGTSNAESLRRVKYLGIAFAGFALMRPLSQSPDFLVLTAVASRGISPFDDFHLVSAFSGIAHHELPCGYLSADGVLLWLRCAFGFTSWFLP
jgi:hypothetical protein